MAALYVFDECKEGNHDGCPGWMNFSAEHIAQDVCSCDCHVEIVVMGFRRDDYPSADPPM